jgi:hypothetical protein
MCHPLAIVSFTSDLKVLPGFTVPSNAFDVTCTFFADDDCAAAEQDNVIIARNMPNSLFKEFFCPQYGS